ncbi:alpha/beta hydrolase family protein [Streptomyces sp. NPDC001530]|uniref:alpha/beta hydrolase family protein n=1 Tax=Streptomyces sp. NPDC001530 TaxID=3364582 RepID=UPI0036944010
MIRVRRIGVAAAALLAVVVGSPGMAHAQQTAVGSAPSAPPADSDGQLPAGWQITGEGAARQLVWRSDEPVPVSDSGVEFYAGSQFLGRPVGAQDGRTFRLALRGTRLGELSDLQARTGGRRLNAAGASEDQPSRRPGLTAQPPTQLPANAVDPGKPGTYRTVTGEYALRSVRLPGFSAPVEMRAVVVAPATAPGHRPLALFLHGRHSTCFTGHGDDVTGEWPCPAGSKPIPSYRGYLRDQKLLASQGYVTVSISANGINGQDFAAEDGGAQARSSLVRQHLARWADWTAHRSSAPRIVRNSAPADLSRVLLVGHSRGGEGVNRAAMDSLYRPPADQDGYRGPVRWHIRGTVLIGPTIFGQNPTPDVPSMTILPGCDGDVSDLQGEMYVDGTRGVSRGAALHSAVYVVGANHNFFNSEWTPGQAQAPAEDDFWAGDQPDRVCSPGTATRLTARQQHAAGATYIAAAARLFVAGDDRVRPLLDGSNRRAPSADPARVLTHAVGARRTPAFLPDGSVTVDGGGRLCAEVDTDAAAACLSSDAHGVSPHFAQWETSKEPGRHAVALKWTAPGTTVRVRPARAVSVAGAEALALRVIVPPNTKDTQFDVTLADASGRRATLERVHLDGLPGTERTASFWGQEIRVPLTAAARAGLDLHQVTALELTPRSRSGRAWLMDAWGWRPGMAAVRPADLPRVDIGRLTVKEGDSGERTYRVPVRVSGHGSGTVRLFVADPASEEATSREVTVRPGSHSLDVPVQVRGNTRFGYDVSHDVFVKAVRGAVVGAHRGGVTALNDDPMPTIKVTPVADRVTEGQSLTWRLSLSAVADTDIQAYFSILPVTGGAELSTTDVNPQWLRENSGESPQPSRPLSTVGGLSLFATIPAGQSTAEVTIPTVADTLTEPEESVRLQETVYDDSGEPHNGPVFTGKVRDAS